MFYCTCGYYTCKRSYKTKLARTQHIAGVKSARKKRTKKGKSSKGKTNIGSKIKTKRKPMHKPKKRNK